MSKQSRPLKLLPRLTDTVYDTSHARNITCPQCGWGAVWLYNEQRCFCVFCRYDDKNDPVALRYWDRIDIYAAIIMDGSGVAA